MHLPTAKNKPFFKKFQLIYMTEKVTEKVTSCNTNVVVDTENLLQCCLCVHGTLRWFLATIILLALLGLAIASVVFFNIYYSYFSLELAIATSISWMIFFIFSTVLGNACFGNFNTSPFRNKKSLFWKWRNFFRTIWPLLMYLLLWLPIINQQFERTKLQDNEFMQFCWIVIGIFWTITVFMFFGTYLAMTLFKPREQKSDEPKETFLLWAASVLHDNWCCMSYPPCKNCGCDNENVFSD